MKFFVLLLFLVGLIIPLSVFSVIFLKNFDFSLLKVTFLDPFIQESIVFTLETILLSISFTLILGIASALALLSFEPRLSRAVAIILVLSALNPPFIGAIGIRQFFYLIGLEDYKVLSLALTQALNLFPVSATLFDTAFRNIDKTLLDTAKLFGLPMKVKLTRIIFPLLTPAFLNFLVFSIAGSLADIGSPLIFEERRFISILIYNLITDKDPFGVGVYLISYYLIIFMIFLSLLKRNIADMNVETLKTAFVSSRVNTSRIVKIILSLILFIFLVVSYIPQFFVIGLSFSSYTGEFTFNNYLLALSNSSFYKAFGISAALSLLSTFAALFSSLYIGWLTKKSPKALSSKVLDLLSIIPQVFPTLLLAFLIIVAYKNTPLDNTSSPLILLFVLYTLRKIPQGVRILSGLLKQIGSELEQVAKVFGIPESSIFIKIYIPLLWQTFFRLTVIFFTTSLFETSGSLVLAVDEKKFPLSKLIYQFYSEPEFFFPGCAMLTLVLFFSYLVTFLVFKILN